MSLPRNTAVAVHPTKERARLVRPFMHCAEDGSAARGEWSRKGNSRTTIALPRKVDASPIARAQSRPDVPVLANQFDRRTRILLGHLVGVDGQRPHSTDRYNPVVNEASRRFVLRALKWILIPFLLFFAGYYVLWPVLADKFGLHDQPPTIEAAPNDGSVAGE